MRRAFVVQLQREATEERCDGRIEHVDSGKSCHFHSLDEAVNFVKQVLAATEEDDRLNLEAPCDEYKPWRLGI